MSDPLNPTLRERLSRAVRPDFARTVLARRLAAGVLVLLAAAIALRPDPAGVYAEVAVAATDLRPGVTLRAADIQLQRYPAAAVPDGAVTDTGRLAGSTLAGPVRRGEVLTDARTLGPRVAELNAGPDARVVPLRLSDTAVLEVIRTGDVVDVLGAPTADREAKPQVLAVGAVVVLVSPESTRPGSAGERVVLVALPRAAAIAVAGAGLVQSVTLTIH